MKADPERPARAHAAVPAVGVLLVNLGTPDAPRASSIRRYLAQFLSDPRVIDLPRWLWLPILHLIVLWLRPRRLAPAYASIWTAEGSPLLAISRRQVQGLEEALSQRFGRQIPVALAMTYGRPGVARAMAQLEAKNVRRLVVIPAYPQYSASSTAAALDAVFSALRGLRWIPELRTIHSYHDAPAYLGALEFSVRRHWATHGRGDHLLISFHGVPQRFMLLGDPYYCQCQKTARLLAERLALPEGAFSVSFQSRFGREPWVHPYTDQELPKLAQHGIQVLDVICPGFAADCLETLEEVSIRYAETFQAAGGRTLRYIGALNADPVHVAALCDIVGAQIEHWLPAPEDTGTLRARADRAKELRPQFFGAATPPP